MLLVDVVLAAAFLLGTFLVASYILGYVRYRAGKLLVPAFIAGASALLPGLVLLLFGLGQWEGEIPLYALVLTAPALGLLLYSLFSLFVRGPKERGGQ